MSKSETYHKLPILLITFANIIFYHKSTNKLNTFNIMGINHQIGDIPVGVIELLFKQFLTTFFIKLKSFFIFVCFWLSSMVQKSNLSNLICSQAPNRSVNHTSFFQTKASILTNQCFQNI